MRKFHYEARDQSTNKIVKSIVQAESEHAAAKTLIQQGFMPLSIKSEEDTKNIFAKLTSRITNKDRVIFLRQLSTLIGAGLPLAQSLRTVAEQTENKKFQEIIQDILTEVEGGKSLSSSLKRYPEVFDTIIIALVSAGEASGTLDEALQRVALQKEKDAETLSKIRGAMVYPGIVMLVIVGVMLFMLLTVVPQVQALYDNLGQSLPWLTAMMINTSQFIIHYWWLVLSVLGVLGYFMGQYLKTDTGIRMKDTLKLNIPLFSAMFRKMYMARFTRTGQTLLATGVAMLDMLRISAESVNNVIIAEEINRAAEKVKGGKALSVALEKEEYVLTMVPQMIKIGEQSGKIDEMMGKTAQVYEDELESEIKGLTTTIEPLLMIVMAVFVGGMVGAILFPIYSLVNKIH
ncbi:MAG TPA: type II secretion system F family protein [Patescibacteria group bacterium]|jgi:type II secretory pathway component PulF|nr:type II secretion system F family protein [Patescibacteria group bacterium]